MQKNIPNLVLYLLAFIEGFILMFSELAGGRVLSIYFGTSIVVWAFVLGFTLLFLAFGYYLGSYFSEKENKWKQLATMFIGLSFLQLMASFYQVFIPITIIQLPFFLALGTSAFLFVALQALFCGAITPIIIKLLNISTPSISSISGKVLAVSTFGGVFSVFMTAFVLLPNIGLQKSFILCSAGFLIKRQLIIVSLLLCVLCSYLFKKNEHHLIYAKEGILGKIEVYDYKDDDGNTIRNLALNQIIQTQWNQSKNTFVSPYIAKILEQINQTDFGKILIIGNGGGALAKALEGTSFQIKAIELDERMIEASRLFFSSSAQLIEADGRVFMANNKDQFDYIVIDVFKGENLPFQLFTKESLAYIEKALLPDGTLFINSNGYTDTENGKANLAILKTLENCGFKANIVKTHSESDYANTLMISKPMGLKSSIPQNDHSILTDDQSDLDLLNARAAFLWRKNYLKALY
jgi:predicted membrane-bound spermidine synthase